MAARVVNKTSVILRMQRMTPEMQRELEGELDVCAQLVARQQRRLAPKHRSLLVNSVRVDQPAPLTRDIGPTAEYAQWQEEGVRPGGPGLPRFEDPESADIVAWLRDKAFRAAGRVRKGSLSGVVEAIALRDRYQGLALHIRRHGVKATPFVEPSLRQLEGEIHRRLEAAAQRGIARGSTPA